MASREDSSARVPVVIVTGYAASGKTLLVNRFLALCKARGLAAGLVLHRHAEEFGITPHEIDARCARYHDVVYDFGSGCLCCSPKGDLIRLLVEWIHRQRELGSQLDVLILRLGPLAAPLLFAKALCTNSEINHHFEVVSIVAVVNAQLASRHLAESSVEWQARAQIACADLVLLNENASSDPADASAFVAAINTEVPIEQMPLPAEAARLEAMLRRRAFSPSRARALDPTFDETGAEEAPARILSLTAHDRRLAACCAVDAGPLQYTQLRTMCEGLAASGRVLRIKGVAQVIGEVDGDMEVEAGGATAPAACAPETWVHIDGVEDSVQFRRAPPPEPRCGDCENAYDAAQPPEASKLFVLGRQLAVGSLRRDFQQCRVPHGYIFAADTQIHFGRRLTASSTMTAGLAPRPRAVPSDLPGVVILREVSPSTQPVSEGGSAETYRAVTRPATYESDAVYCEALAAGRVDAEGASACHDLPVLMVDGAIYVQLDNFN